MAPPIFHLLLAVFLSLYLIIKKELAGAVARALQQSYRLIEVGRLWKEESEILQFI